MVNTILNNSGTIVALGFAAVGLLLLIVVVLAGLFGVTLDPGAFDLVKMVTVTAMGYGIGSGTQASVARAQAMRADAVKLNDQGRMMWDGDKWFTVQKKQ